MKKFKFNIQLFADEEQKTDTTPQNDDSKIAELEKKIAELEKANEVLKKEKDEANSTIMTMQNQNSNEAQDDEFKEYFGGIV